MLGNKAIGLDGLKDTSIKQCLTKETTLEKCRITIQNWLNSGSIPAYLKHSKVIALSKIEGIYPKVGEIRTISILPAFSKIVERIVNSKL